MKLLKGKRLKPVMRLGNQSSDEWGMGEVSDRKAGSLLHILFVQGCTFSSAGQHQFALPDKTLGKVTA